jgi:hypothetical protein
MKDSTSIFIREILRVQAEPPRQVKYVNVLGAVFKEKSMRFIFFFGLIMASPLFLVISDGRPSDRFFYYFFELLPLVIAAVPFYYARRILNAIKIGRRLTAKVESVEYIQNSRDTLNATKNGIAQGFWRLPEGQLIDFRIDQTWAKDIKVGSQVDILVVTPKINGTFPLGLQE